MTRPGRQRVPSASWHPPGATSAGIRGSRRLLKTDHGAEWPGSWTQGQWFYGTQNVIQSTGSSTVEMRPRG